MAFNNRFSNKPYLGELADDAAADTFVTTENLDTNGNGTGVTPDGAFYYNTTTSSHRFRQGGAWSAGGTSDHGALTGLGDDDHTQYTLADGTRAFTGDQSMGSNKLTNVATPTVGTDAANKDYVDAAAAGLEWQDSVIDKDLTAPPGGPTTGDRYIVASVATGAWAGQEDNIAEFNGATWDFTTPTEGFAAWVDDEDTAYVYNGSAWVKMAGTFNHDDLGNISGGAAADYHHLTSAQRVALTDDGGVTDASTQHTHDDRYFTETELGNTGSGTEGAALIGTDTKTNLANATTVEAALSDLDDKNPTSFQSGAGTPIGAVVPKMIGGHYLNTSNGLGYRAIGVTSADWRVD